MRSSGTRFSGRYDVTYDLDHSRNLFADPGEPLMCLRPSSAAPSSRGCEDARFPGNSATLYTMTTYEYAYVVKECRYSTGGL